ncbi:sensor histidine kinase [Gracilibacillus alcaliphilus]|uniref:sensor histidine kinase n=1 Tax=Gracilibacillus alcaliphilus TaxID=1401441 RepID=UPI0019583609|nr:histidine kinase [Gracilibacillus alcaliphilus]MBM7677122.1 sensor histidine kinase YesM/uncharacterized BrkB/YihY/UPF0761 family membrane protein [Gracilibacillus alcaliphilus]
MEPNRLLAQSKKIPLKWYLIMLSVLLTTIFTIILGTIYHNKIQQFLSDKNEEAVELKLAKIAMEIEESSTKALQAAETISASDFVADSLQKMTDDDYSVITQYHSLQELERYLYQLRVENHLLENIIILTNSNQVSSDKTYLPFAYNGLTFNQSEANFPTNMELFELKNDVYSGRFLQGAREFNHKPFLGITIPHPSGGPNATALLFLDYDNLVYPSAYLQDFLLFNQEKQVLYNGLDSQAEAEIAHFSENFTEGFMEVWDHYELFGKRIPSFNLYVLYGDSLEEYHLQQQFIWKVILVITLFMILSAVLLAERVSRKALDPLQRLVHFLRTNRDMNPDRFTLTKWNSRLGFKERLFLYFFMTILVPLFLFIGLYYWQSSQLVFAEIKENNQLKHHSKLTDVRMEFLQSTTTLAKIVLDSQLYNYIENKELEAIYDTFKVNRSYFVREHENLYMYDRYNQLLYSTETHAEQELSFAFRDEMKRSRNQIVYHVTIDEFGHHALQLGTALYNVNRHIIGFAVMELSNDDLMGLYQYYEGDNEETFIIDKEGYILSAVETNLIGHKLDLSTWEEEPPITNDHDMYYHFENGLGGNQNQLISRHRYADTQSEINQLFLSDSYLLFGILIVVAVFSYWIPRRVVKQLDHVNSIFDMLDIKGASGTFVEKISGIDEIDLLQRKFHQNMKQMNVLINETIEANKELMKANYEKKEIQMNALQAQVNPHFLYNTLDNLLYLIESDHDERAVDMINALSSFFRYVTHREMIIISVKEEINFTKAYLSIMEHRFDNFDCSWDVEAGVEQIYTIKLILQPLIENAINHAVRQANKKINIRVSCYQQAQQLIFKVEDNGQGIDQEKLASIQQSLRETIDNKSGIYNVNARVRNYCGAAYGVSIASSWGSGTIVTAVLPLSMDNMHKEQDLV